MYMGLLHTFKLQNSVGIIQSLPHSVLTEPVFSALKSVNIYQLHQHKVLLFMFEYIAVVYQMCSMIIVFGMLMFIAVSHESNKNYMRINVEHLPLKNPSGVTVFCQTNYIIKFVTIHPLRAIN